MTVQHGKNVVNFPELAYQYLVLKEGYRLDVYKDHKGIPTVGVGHKVVPADKLNFGDKITPERAFQLFQADFNRLNIAEYTSEKSWWEGNQRLAIASFIWSHGDGQYKTSTLRAKLSQNAPKADTLAYLKANWDIKSPKNQKRNADDISLFYDPKPFTPQPSAMKGFFRPGPLSAVGFWLADFLLQSRSL